MTTFMKHLQRVRINIDQNLGRAEKSEVLNEYEQNLERRVELLKTVCQNLHKKVISFLRSQGPSTDVEKRLKKLPESGLSHCLIESSVQFGQDSGTGQVFHLAGDAQGAIATIVLAMETDIEQRIIVPIRDMVEVDYPLIQKLKKQMKSLILDMDSAKQRYTNAQKQAQAGMQTKLDEARLEVEDANNKVEQVKDQLATEMYNFVSKESDVTKCLQELAQIQADYHRQSLGILDRVIPQLQENIEFSIKKPVFGQLLQEHLEAENREIAYVLEECIAVLNEFGMAEEGLFRIAGSTSKIKKLKAAFNSSQRPAIAEEDIDVNVISSVLKLYLRELPEPLMCSEHYNEWLHTLQKPPEQRLSSMRDVIQKLPKANQQNLRYLIKFLAKLSESSDVNKMSPSNISLVIAPNLLWPKGETGPNMLTTGLQSSIVETLVANANYFFPGDIDFSGSRPSLSSPSNNSVDTNNGNNMQQPFGIGSITANVLTGIVSPEITHDNMSSSSASPGTLKRGPKKPPAPLPPSDSAPLLHPVFGKSLSSGGNGQTSGNITPRLSAPEPASPFEGSGSPKPDRSSSPTLRHERPKMPPPERPQVPPPEKPNPALEKPTVAMEKPPLLREKPSTRATMYSSTPEKPAITTKPGMVGDAGVSPPEKPHTKLYPSLTDVVPDKDVTPASHQGHVRQSSYGGVGPKPPRPQPPPPPATRP